MAAWAHIADDAKTPWVARLGAPGSAPLLTSKQHRCVERWTSLDAVWPANGGFADWDIAARRNDPTLTTFHDLYRYSRPHHPGSPTLVLVR